MEFELFLTNCQKMYSIFVEECEPMERDAKTRFMFKWVEQSDLQKLIEVLEAHMENKT